MISNITQGISSKIGRNLHNTKNHPIEIIKRKIYDFFGNHFKKFDDLSPIVNIEDNFDNLLIAKDHPARSLSDTYYKDENHVLRTQTSAHQTPLLKSGERQFLVTGDVYRKDDIDATHYPVFHQMEGLFIDKNVTMAHLKGCLTDFIRTFFNVDDLNGTSICCSLSSLTLFIFQVFRVCLFF